MPETVVRMRRQGNPFDSVRTQSACFSMCVGACLYVGVYMHVGA